MNLIRFTRALIFVFVLVVGSPAWAQDEEQIARAAEEDALGKKLYDQGDYAGAADAFGRAYRLYPIPPILKSRIVALAKAENCGEIDVLMGEHLEEIQSLPEEELIDIRRIRTDCAVLTAEKALEAEEAGRARAALAEAEDHDREARRTADIAALREQLEELEASREVVDNPPPPDDTIRRPADPPGPSMRHAWGLALLGCGLASLGGAGILTLGSYDADLHEYEELCDTGPNPTCPTEEGLRLHKRLQSRFVAHVALIGLGSVLAVSGVAVLLTRPERNPVTLRVSPVSASLALGF